MTGEGQATVKTRYEFTPAEREHIGGLIAAVARAQASFEAALNLIHVQQGLQGNYNLTPDCSAMVRSMDNPRNP